MDILQTAAIRADVPAARVHHRALQGPGPGGAVVVLVVDEDDDKRERTAVALVREGYSVLTCAGPRPPTYTCPGGKGQECPLAALADVVVLDLRLEADTIMEGVPGWQLVLYYASIGKPVVAVADDPMNLVSEERVAVLRGEPGGGELASAVHSVLAAGEGVLDLTDLRGSEVRRRR